MPRPRYQIAEADVAVVHWWVRSKFCETAPLDTPIIEQLQQWCDQCLDAAQWKQLHAVIRAARRDASHQTRTVRLSTHASALLHDLAAREQLTLSETVEKYLTQAPATNGRADPRTANGRTHGHTEDSALCRGGAEAPPCLCHHQEGFVLPHGEDRPGAL